MAYAQRGNAAKSPMRRLKRGTLIAAGILAGWSMRQVIGVHRAFVAQSLPPVSRDNGGAGEARRDPAQGAGSTPSSRPPKPTSC